jgi:hypothetical protein
VGKTARDVETRLSEHRSLAKSGKVTHLYCWWRALGVEPVIGVLEKYNSEKEASLGEMTWIKALKETGARLVNHSDGGEGQTGLKHTQETKDKISKRNKGVKKPGTSKALTGRKRGYFRPCPEETKIATSRKMGGRAIVDQNGNIYQTTRSACKRLGLDQSHVVGVLKGRGKSHKGYVFKYIESQS